MNANWKNRTLFCALALLLGPMAGHAEDLSGFNQERFQLWNNCEPVEVDVLLLSDAESIVTRSELITFAVASLMDAGIQAFDAAIYALEKNVDTRLAIIVEKVGLSLYVQFNYIKYYAQDSMSQAKGWGINWSTSMGVPYASLTNLESTKIQISVLLDSFARNYLHVNADACAR